ncbi:ParB/Srx family N-terminal domain-containing protein [Micromonospora sp. NPDC004704]
MTLTETTTDPSRIAPLHDAEDEDKLTALTESMTEHGWVGAPIVVITTEDGDPQAITGSHRLAAAREAGIDVPTVNVADLLAAHGHDLPALIAEFTAAGFDLPWYGVVVRLPELLPADVLDQYGLDAH